MKKIQATVIVCVLLFAVVAIAQEKPWFDPKGCAICSNFAKEPGLWEHTHSDYIDVPDGMVAVCHVDKEFRAAYKRAQEGMAKVIVDLQAGKQVPLDGFCTAVGGFMAAGVIPESFDGETGSVMVLRSKDPEQVKKIHAFSAKTVAEMAKMAAPPANKGQ